LPARAEPQRLRVFVGDDGRGGNALAVFVDGGAIAPEDRQATAAEIGYSETVFVDDADRGDVHIFTPAAELDFAGHPMVGTAWLLKDVEVLRPPAGEVRVRREGEVTWVSGRPEWGPPYELEQLDSPADVDAHPGAGPDALLQVWAWEDEGRGVVRARVFCTAIGIPEDEATGSAAVRLGSHLNRDLLIRQGVGSRIHVRPAGDGFVEVGGRSQFM
jgi:predicted PhzF superfamily epimerase YddE/YHI9